MFSTKNQAKDEETLEKEFQEKLDKLFKELDHSIETKQYKLSKVIYNAILKHDPNNEKIEEYLEKIPDTTEEGSSLILLTPGVLAFLLFYKFTKQTEETHKDYFDKKEIEKFGKTQKADVDEEKKKRSIQEEKYKLMKSFKPHENKNKFKFSTINQHSQNENIRLGNNKYTQNKLMYFNQQPKYQNIQKYMSNILKRII